MRIKLLVVVLTLMLIVPAFAQEKIIGEKFGIKKSIALDEDNASIQLLSDKARAVMLLPYVWDEDLNLNHYLKLSANSIIYFFVDYCVTRPTDIRFHYVWTGPEYYSWTSDWYSTLRNKYYSFGVYTNNNWQKGIYTLTIIAEQDSSASGAECVATCRVRFY
jgi:hypothetical protein